MARPLRRDHDHVVPGGGGDALVEDVEAVREEDGRVGLEVRLDELGEDRRLHLVGEEERDELRAADGVGDRAHLEPCLLGLRPRGRALAQADDDRTPESWRFSAWAWPWLP